jgi:hypothetical protein
MYFLIENLLHNSIKDFSSLLLFQGVDKVERVVSRKEFQVNLIYLTFFQTKDNL